jgi:hypothetical protein
VITATERRMGGSCTGVLTLPGGQVVGQMQALPDTSGTDSHEPFTLELSR